MLSPWSPERVELLRKLVPGGHSYSVCAAEVSALPGPPISRNAAIGKATRLGISQARSPMHTVRKARALRKNPLQIARMSPAHRALAQERREEFRAAPDLVIPPDERRGLLDLDPGTCRWPIGDPKQPDFHFCNRLQIGTDRRDRRGLHSYCPFHAARSSDGPAVRRRTHAAAPATAQQTEPVA